MKRKLSLIIALCLLITVLFSGCGEELGLGNADVKIKIENGVAKVTELPNKTGITEVTIPDEYEGVPVTEIADFAGCNLEDVVKINIGKNVQTIGNWAFANDQKLTEFNVDPGNECFCSVDGVLFTKDMTELLFYPPAKDAVDSGEVDDDGNKIFRITYEVPEGVTKIRTRAFYKCANMYELTLPNSLTVIEEQAFFKCSSLVSISIPDAVTFIGKDAFSYCEGLTEITIPSSVTEIGDYAFFNCKNVSTVNMLCQKENVKLGAKWQPTDNGIEIKALKINWN